MNKYFDSLAAIAIIMFLMYMAKIFLERFLTNLEKKTERLEKLLEAKLNTLDKKNEQYDKRLITLTNAHETFTKSIANLEKTWGEELETQKRLVSVEAKMNLTETMMTGFFSNLDQMGKEFIESSQRKALRELDAKVENAVEKKLQEEANE